MKEYQNIKVWLSTLMNLRRIYGLTNEKMVSVLDRLVKAEYERLVASNQDKENER